VASIRRSAARRVVDVQCELVLPGLPLKIGLTPSGRLWLIPNSLFPSGAPSGPHMPEGSPGSDFSVLRPVPVADPPDIWVGRELRIRLQDAARLRLILKVKDGVGGGDWWVECGTCECGWQVRTTPRRVRGQESGAATKRSALEALPQRNRAVTSSDPLLSS
jgi:hypothetical protein